MRGRLRRLISQIWGTLRFEASLELKDFSGFA